MFRPIPKAYSKGILTLLIAAFIFHFTTWSQNAPVTTLATAANAVAGQVSVPITVTGFNDIGAVSLTFDYAYAGLHFSLGIPNPSLPGLAIGDQDLGNGQHRVTLGWFGSGVTLPAGTTIVTLQFTYIAGTTALQFHDNGPSCEYADGTFNVLNDIPQGTYYIDGLVCGAPGSAGIITGDGTVCEAATGIAYSVAPLPNATGYTWTVPPGAVIASGNNTNAITVNYPAGAQSGYITVCGTTLCGAGPLSQSAVTVSPLPAANAGNDITIPYGTSTILHAAPGGAGAFSYHWSPENLLINPNLQDAQTVNLTVTTVFTLLVTNQASQCSNTDEVTVTITGGPLNASPVAMPAVVCNGSSSYLFANAGGGSGTYTYAWSSNPPGSPPWSSSQANPVVTPGVTTTYLLTLSDGFTATSGSTQVTVNALPAATISGGDTLCGEGLSTVLSINLTGSPPWQMYYSNGLTTWFAGNLLTSPFLVNATAPGNYTVLSVSDVNCTGTTSGVAPVVVHIIPPTPVIYVNGTEISSTGCCGNQWYMDGLQIPGATSQNYAPLQSAHYFSIVTVDGCQSDTSNTIYYFMAGERPPQKPGHSVSYNPGEHRLTIKGTDPGSLTDCIITVFDRVGRTIYAGPITIASPYVGSITLNPVPALGIYLVSFRGPRIALYSRFLIP